jgi:hypothetical protein
MSDIKTDREGRPHDDRCSLCSKAGAQTPLPSWRTTVTIPGRCKPTSVTRTFNTRSGTPNWRRTGSRISGGRPSHSVAKCGDLEPFGRGYPLSVCRRVSDGPILQARRPQRPDLPPRTVITLYLLAYDGPPVAARAIEAGGAASPVCGALLPASEPGRAHQILPLQRFVRR